MLRLSAFQHGFVFQSLFRRPVMFAMAVATILPLSAGCEQQTTLSQRDDVQAASNHKAAPVTAKFKPDERLINRFATASKPAEDPLEGSKFNICLHDTMDASDLEKALWETSIETSVVMWWGAVDKKYFPEGYVRRTIDDIHSEWASVASGTFGNSCNLAKTWDLHVYIHAEFMERDGAFRERLAAFGEDPSWKFPGTIGPAVFLTWFADHTTNLENALHEIGHFLGLADTYEMPVVTLPNGKKRCVLRRDPDGTTMSQERQPASIMCDSEALTPHDYEAADCMYCATWPGGMMIEGHPCKKLLASSQCKDLRL
jgi:hypothetical protein